MIAYITGKSSPHTSEELFVQGESFKKLFLQGDTVYFLPKVDFEIAGEHVQHGN